MQTKVEGVDKSNLPFKITASKATQSTTNSKTVDLEDVTGEFARSGAEKLDVSSAKAAYDSKARTLELEGEVVIEFTVTASGQVKDPVIKSSTNRLFNRASMAVIDRLTCQGQGQDVRVQAAIGFKLR